MIWLFTPGWILITMMLVAIVVTNLINKWME